MPTATRIAYRANAIWDAMSISRSLALYQRGTVGSNRRTATVAIARESSWYAASATCGGGGKHQRTRFAALSCFCLAPVSSPRQPPPACRRGRGRCSVQAQLEGIVRLVARSGGEKWRARASSRPCGSLPRRRRRCSPHAAPLPPSCLPRDGTPTYVPWNSRVLFWFGLKMPCDLCNPWDFFFRVDSGVLPCYRAGRACAIP